MRLDRFIKQNLYMLKMQHGVRAIIDHLVASEVNVETGVLTEDRQRFAVSHAIKLPELFERDTIGIGKGAVDVGTCEWIIDRQDVELPELTASDSILESGEVYQVQSVELLHTYGWVVVARRVGASPAPILESVSNNLGINSDTDSD
jgi:hypothetical protein